MADQRSFATRVADGSTQNFSFSFAYFDREDINVFVDGELVTAWVLGQGGNAVSLATAPPSGAKVTIKRVTPTVPKVTYKDGAVLTNEQLNLSQQQTLYLTEEALDRAERAIEQHEGNFFDAKGLTVRNAGAPSDPTDLITKGYHDDVWIPQMNAIKDATQDIKDTFQPEVDAAIVDAEDTVQAVADVNKGIIEGIRTQVFAAQSDVQTRQVEIETSFDATVSHVDSVKASVDASQTDVTTKYNEIVTMHSEADDDRAVADAQAAVATTKANEATDSAAQAQAFRNEAQGFRTEAQAAQTAAEAAESGSVALFGTLDTLNAKQLLASEAASTAVLAKTSAETARDAALSYRDTAKTHSDSAAVKAGEASVSAAEALVHLNATITLNDEAQVFRDQAETVQTDLFTARDLVIQRAADAETAKAAAQAIQSDVNTKVGLAETARQAANNAASNAALSATAAQETADSVAIQQEVLTTAVATAESHKLGAQQAAAEAQSAVNQVDTDAIRSTTIIYSILFG